MVDTIQIMSSAGDGLSWAVEKISLFFADTIGITLNAFQSSLISLLILAFGIYLVISVLTIGKKLIKWGIILLLVLLVISVIVSLFA